MILEDITYKGSLDGLELPDSRIVLGELIPIQSQVLVATKIFLDSYDSNIWLRNASTNVLAKIYIEEAKKKIEECKSLLNTNKKEKRRWLLKLR